MSVPRWLQIGLLLLLVAVPISVPGLQTTSYGGWPAVGLAAALFLVSGRATRPVTFAALTVVAGLALSASYDVAVWQGFFGSLSLSLPALLCTILLERRGQGRGPLDELDVGFFTLATALSGLLCGVLAALDVVVLLGPRQALLAALMSFLAGLTALLVVLPLLLRQHRDAITAADAVELWAERLVLVVVLLVVFGPTAPLALAFTVLPVLGWAALRASRHEAFVQLFAVALVAYGATFLNHGPFTEPVGNLPDDLDPAVLYLFIASACFLTVPLALTVERLARMTGQATRAAVTVERMLDSATGTLFIASDTTGHITHFNSGAEQTLGYRPDDVLEQSTRMFHTDQEIARQAEALGVPPDYAEVVLAQVRSGERRDWEFRCQDGTTRMCSLRVTELTSPTGKVQGYIASGEDITERLRAQRAMEAALERDHASLLRLQAVDHVKQELVSNVSHELRTPITSIAGYTELLAEGDLGELTTAQEDAVPRIGRNASRLGVLVDDLLTLSREESDQLHIAAEVVDLREVVHETEDLVEELLRGRELDVRLDVPEAAVVVRGDPGALERVASNLLSNAVKFTPDGGHVSVSVETDTTSAAIVVTDTGMGISEEEQEQLFTRFFRTSAATAQAIQGSGLGLSIVHAIVTRHGGHVSVQSQPGVGTTVRAELPLLV